MAASIKLTNHNVNAMSAAENVDYLHPELMTKDKLISILKERLVNIAVDSSDDKCQLVAIYNEHVLPLPQRISGHSHRWQRLYAKLCTRQKRKPNEQETNGNEDAESTTPNKISRLSGKNAKRDRLKSPPKIDRAAPTSNKRNLSKSKQSETVAESTECDTKVSKAKQKRQKITWP